MALIKCRECGREISSQSVACPGCGAPVKKKTRAEGCLIAVGLVFIVALLAGVFGRPNSTNNTSSSPTPSSTVQTEPDSVKQQRQKQERIAREESELKAIARLSSTQIVIENANSFSWRNAKLEVNGTFSLFGSGKGYRVNVGSVPEGHKLTIGLMQFANSDGERFNPFTHKVRSLCVTADTPHTTGVWCGDWP